MIRPWLFQLVILLSWPINSLAKSPTTAKHNCPTSCGNVSIPFPFGIGSSCYLEFQYAINCSSNKPILSSIGLEILDISLEASTMVVNHPVVSSCPDRENKKIVNLENTPFFYSRDQNRFTGVGCNNFAYLYTSSASSIINGCLSVCDNSRNTAETMSCYGIKCCQTRIPSSLDLQVFNASVDTINYERRRQKKCKYAFLVKQDWFEENIKSPNRIHGFEYVPVVLDWGIRKQSMDLLVIRNSSSTYLLTSNCRIFASSLFTVSRCSCSKGYQGNPYFFQGCQDIDECEVKDGTICQSNGANCKIERTNPCPPNTSCINTVGSFWCYPPEILPPTKSNVKWVILGFGIGVGALFLCIGLWWLLYIINIKRKKIKLKEKYFKRNGGLLLGQQLTSFDGSVDKGKLFNSKELDKATDHFNVNRILGKGGQGTVYKGMLTDGRIVAVKKSVVDEGNLEEFINEVVILSQINHRNVVKLLGCCLETEVPLLVYEYIPNGTLYQYLHNQNEELPLTWEMRLQIAAEVAEALSYLHSAASLPIYHRDIKSSNILLDDKYRAKIADFGTSRSIAIDQTHITTKVQGTFGYLDPEFFQTSQFSDKSDVYSFGVVLVELLTRQKPISSTRSHDIKGLATRFILSMLENNLFDILDLEVIDLGKKEDIMTVANLAKRCLNLSGKRRPMMKEVAMVLEGIRASSKESNVQQNFDEVDMRTKVF